MNNKRDVSQEILSESYPPLLELGKSGQRAADLLLEQVQSLLAVLEHFRDGILLLDHSLRVIYSTQIASELLASCGNWMRVKSGRLVIKERQARERILDMLENGSPVPAAQTGSVLLMRRCDPFKLPLIISVHPLPKTGSHSPTAARLMMALHDPESPPTPAWPLFAQQYELTAKEVELCQALIRGQTLAIYSKRHCVSYATARAHLKSVLHKTGLHRQADLVTLVYAFARF